MAAHPESAAAKPAATLENLVITRASSGKSLEFKIEVARTPYQKALGLMFRRELQPLHGMLFPYPKVDDISMWMKNTYIPLDMLFIKPNGEIHHIEEMTEPLSERSSAPMGPSPGSWRLPAVKPNGLVLQPATESITPGLHRRIRS